MATLSKVIEDAIEARLGSVYTMLPGVITKVDVAKGQCEVQPLIKRKFSDGEVLEQPRISNVPIANYRAGNAFITLPVKVGDTVELRFSQRSLDIWLSKGGNVDPLDARKFHITDCVAYPGMYPFDKPPTGASPDNIVIKNEDSTLVIKPDQIDLYGSGDAVALASKVMDRLDKIKTAFDGHTHPATTTATIGNGGPGAVTVSPPTSGIPDLDDVGSTKVKAE